MATTKKLSLTQTADKIVDELFEDARDIENTLYGAPTGTPTYLLEGLYEDAKATRDRAIRVSFWAGRRKLRARGLI